MRWFVPQGKYSGGLVMSTQQVHRAFRYTSAVATTAIACFTYSVLALLLLHVLRPDYAPVNHMISDYAVGRYGWVMTTWFLATSCGCLMLLLVRSGPQIGSRS